MKIRKVEGHIVSSSARTARAALADVSAGQSVHGITDGSWSLIDALRELVIKCGPCPLTLSTWTGNGSDFAQAERLLRSDKISDFKLMVDRSFLTRQPGYCATARALFGDDAIRVWSSHAKFAIVGPVLFLTSMNLNENKRVESFSAIHDAPLVAQYQALVDAVFQLQGAGVGFEDPKAGRRVTKEALNALS